MMELIKILKTDFEFNDERGKLVQLVHMGQKQVNYVFSKGGVFRGNHYHADNIESFYVISGKFQVDVKKDGMEESYVFGAGDFFAILPGVMHSFYYIEDTQLIGMYDRGVEYQDGTKDIIACE